MYNISSSSPLQLLYYNLYAAYIFYFKVTTMGCISAALSGPDLFPIPHPPPREECVSVSRQYVCNVKNTTETLT